MTTTTRRTASRTHPVVRISRALSRDVSRLDFAPPVTHVYNPLDYARACHDQYVERFARQGVRALLLGMNPGPWGMAQTGVPFGEVTVTREWLGIDAPVKRPRIEHPKRPILGFDCERSEVSGRRLWGWAKRRFESPDAFFERFFVWNYCPLAFLEETGRNRTPDKLPAAEREQLFDACDKALGKLVDTLAPSWVIGIGAFATARARAALSGRNCEIGTVLHPSPASPVANRGWEPQAEAQLEALGIEL